MPWELATFDDVNLNNMTREQFNSFWGVNMKLFKPLDMPAGSVYYKLVGLHWRDGWCGLTVHVIDDMGEGIEGEQVFQGWRDGSDLPPDTVPVGGQPAGYPHKGDGGFTNAEGDHGFGWGDGEWFDPRVTEGPHWYWRGGENGAYSDVVCGFGWWDDHETIEPIFMRTIVEDGGNGGNGDATLDDVVEQLKRIADALEDFTICSTFPTYIATPAEPSVITITRDTSDDNVSMSHTGVD